MRSNLGDKVRFSIYLMQFLKEKVIEIIVTNQLIYFATTCPDFSGDYTNLHR